MSSDDVVLNKSDKLSKFDILKNIVKWFFIILIIVIVVIIVIILVGAVGAYYTGFQF